VKRLAGLCLALGAACQGPRAGFFAQAPGPTHPRGRVEIYGVDGRALEGLRVSVAAEERVPALLGSTRYENGRIVFEPRFPFERALEYRARLGREQAWTFSFPAIERPRTTELTRVYPSAEVLPSNLLKFYLHFSAPMRRGEARRRVRLLDEFGSELGDAFLELEAELWDPERTRLTLFIQPGRIKRGLVPHVQLGPVFEQGRRYTLEIDADWRDAQGVPLRQGSSKVFRAAAPDHTSPDPAHWQVSPPRAAFTREALHVRTDEALDHALLERLVNVRGPDGLAVSGSKHVAESECSWSFVPDEPWRPGKHSLEVGGVLEDLAGNSVGRPFEEPPRPGDEPVPDSVSVPFTVPRNGKG